MNTQVFVKSKENMGSLKQELEDEEMEGKKKKKIGQNRIKEIKSK